MHDPRKTHLGWVEAGLRAAHPSLDQLRLSAQSHYGPPEHIAYISVHGLGDDRALRKQLQADAADLLSKLGYRVSLEPGRDVYDIRPIRALSAHEEIHMLSCLRRACAD